ncbi:MAG: hypothetical protein AB1416_08090 [Actinomycetota bacterium]
MARDTQISLSRLSALISRLDPHVDGTCTVPGCVHEVAARPVTRLRRRPPSVPPRRPAAPQAA